MIVIWLLVDLVVDLLYVHPNWQVGQPIFPQQLTEGLCFVYSFTRLSLGFDFVRKGGHYKEDLSV